MKRIFIGLMVLALALPPAGTALAIPPGPKPVPKVLCLAMGETVATWDTLLLANKLVGTIPTAEGPIKFFAINGEYVSSPAYSIPLAGTGHVKNGVFHFSVTGSTLIGTDPASQYIWTWFIEGFWNLANNSGTCYVQNIDSNGGHYHGPANLYPRDWTTVIIPY